MLEPGLDAARTAAELHGQLLAPGARAMSRNTVPSIRMSVGATVLPSFFLNAALHRISAQANATIGTLSPVMTIALAVAILGEPLTLVDVIGTILVLAGVGWFTLADQYARRKAAKLPPE